LADFRDAREEIRGRIGILDLVSEYVTLKRAGKSLKGLCPFHAEKTPSFTVNEVFGTWRCFGCGEHGDIFTFLMKMENLTFAEAIERLAQRCGVQLDQPDSASSRRAGRKEILAGINSLATGYYSAMLKKMPSAVKYLHDRGLADSTIEQFHIGYAPAAWDGLLQYLGKKGIEVNDAIEAGLLIRSERDSFYDRFRNRIVFPILDIQERIIGFGGRAIGDDQPKYLNSPETPLFVKTRSLYGMNLARKAIASADRVLVVEGYMDTITVHQAGFANCVATLGTALTQEHINVLARLTKNVVLTYDADSAGMKAALRGAYMFEQAECDVRIARLPKGEDPDSLIRTGKVAEFATAIDNALPIAGYRIADLLEKHDLSTVVGKTAMLNEAAKVLSEVSSFTDRERYIKELAAYHPNWGTGTAHAEDHIRADVETQIRKRHGDNKPVARPNVKAGRPGALDQAQRIVLRVLILGEEGADTVLEALSPEKFSGEVFQKAAEALFGMFREKRGIYLTEILEKSDPETANFLNELAMREGEPPISEKALKDCLAWIENSGISKTRTSEILAPGMKNGAIDPEGWSEGQGESFSEYLRRKGKLKRADE
jgi:DNA primase